MPPWKLVPYPGSQRVKTPLRFQALSRRPRPGEDEKGRAKWTLATGPLSGTELCRCRGDSAEPPVGAAHSRNTQTFSATQVGGAGTEATETLAGVSEKRGEGGPERAVPHLCPGAAPGPYSPGCRARCTTCPRGWSRSPGHLLGRRVGAAL